MKLLKYKDTSHPRLLAFSFGDIVAKYEFLPGLYWYIGIDRSQFDIKHHIVSETKPRKSEELWEVFCAGVAVSRQKLADLM